LGGEEFVVLLPLDGIAAVEVANKLRQQIECTQFETVSAVTVSIGVAQIRPEELLEEALRRADMLLYCAKQAGRNRVEAGSTTVQSPLIQQCNAYGEGSESPRGALLQK
jgi:diguanylate cyclase (GGDEF)-like protein